MKPLLTLWISLFFIASYAQDYYYPPLEGNDWETLSLEDLTWCQDKVDDLLQFLEERDTKAFIILKDGRIALEQYFGSYTQDSIWYWASAGKSLMGTMIGLAQEDGLLDIEEPVSNYLGETWTSCSAEEEAKIKIRHQISMASGLDDGVEPAGSANNCFDPSCFHCIAEPEMRWAYHNSAYRLSQDVMEIATGQDKTVYNRLRLGNRIGMKGFWFNYIYFSKARDMARFGHFILSEGVWNGDPVMQDANYYQNMLETSQEQNQAYGYLWWLNGKASYQLPALQFEFQGSLIPNAPNDLVAALGKNDQKIYVVPSLDMVVVRQGDSAGGVSPALSSFDNELWMKILELECLTSIKETNTTSINISPNPARQQIQINGIQQAIQLSLLNQNGQVVLTKEINNDQVISISNLPSGIYWVHLKGEEDVRVEKLLVY